MRGGRWVERQKLTPSDGDVEDFFGRGVALSASGKIALVGAFSDCAAGEFCGAAYVFVREDDRWVERQKLTASDPDIAEEFGISVALSASGKIALVGAWEDRCGAGGPGDVCGAAYMFVRKDDRWVERQKLIASDAAIGDQFGFSVALSASGKTALVGAHGDGCVAGMECGAAYVFRRKDGRWVERQKLTASDAARDDEFGVSVALSASGKTALVGAQMEDTDRGGAAYVFRKDVAAPLAFEFQNDIDGNRVVYSSNAAGNGVPPEQAVQDIIDAINELDDDAFKLPALNRKNARENELQEVIALINAGDIAKAIAKLQNDIRATMDGSLGGNPNNDWIIDPDAQAAIVALIDDLIAELQALQSSSAKLDSGKPQASPEQVTLFQNYPNPYNPETEIRFRLPEASPVVVKIYNLFGEEIRTLVDKTYPTGHHSLRWDGRDNSGKAVSSGVYFYRLQAGSFMQVKKMNLLR